jgi:four helix bundle protein
MIRNHNSLLVIANIKLSKNYQYGENLHASIIACLDLLEQPNLPLLGGFRNQLERAALSISNNVAEGFERLTTNELISCLAIAKGLGARCAR